MCVSVCKLVSLVVVVCFGFSFALLLDFVLFGAGRLQGKRADMKGWGDGLDQDAWCETHRE